jgi:hypothetical protein
MTAVSSINPLRVAVVAALKALPIIGGPASGRVFHTQAKRSAAYPFIVLDNETETEEGARYGQGGQGPGITFRCWGADSWEAQEVFAAAKGALHGVALTVTGFKVVNPQVARVNGFRDRDAEPDALGPYCVVGDYSAETKVI